MNLYSLNIAGYNLHLESAANGPELVPSARFRNFLCDYTESGITIKVHAKKYIPGAGTTRVFHAPYYEEVLKVAEKKADDFWSIYTEKDKLLIKITYPSGNPGKGSWLRFSLTDTRWDLFIDTDKEILDPLEYPLDGLILYYLSVINGDIFIHGSGINYKQKGYLFTGSSGQGKTTMAKIWNEAGATIIHDDRLIIRNLNDNYVMHNTPVYENESPLKSDIDSIFIISHGTKNEKQVIHGANALTNIMANCIQHNWSPEIISRLTASLYNLSSNVITYKLYFIPDTGIISYIN